MSGRAESKRVRFNKTALEKLALPDKGRVYVFDSETPALAVSVSSSGAKVFYVSRRIGGVPKRVRIGRYPEVTVQQAQREAARVNGQIAEGKDPHNERQLRRGGETLEAIYDRYIEAPTRRKQAKAARTVADYKEQWDQYLSPLADRKLSTIHSGHVDKLHAEIGEGDKQTRHFQANRVLALLSAIFEYAIRDGAQVVNPCRSVERYPEPSRDRAIQQSEMPDYLKAVKAEPDQRMQDFFAILLYTGARKSNVMAARWDEIDLKRKVWQPTIKGNKAHTIPLVKEAVAILKRRERDTDDSEWVYPAHGKTGHVVEPRPQWKRILTTAKLSDLRIHDLRRTLASWMADQGATETIIGAVLGHSPKSVTGVYARVTEDARREAMQKAVSAMLKTKGMK